MAVSPTNKVIRHLRGAVLRGDGAGLTDGQLLQEYLSSRDESALAALVRRHGAMVWGVCRRVLQNDHDAEDAFQATFLVFLRKAATLVSPHLLANWLYGVAYQTALKARATTAKRKSREKQVIQMPVPAVTESDRWHDLQTLLDEELSRLPDKYRIAIILCELQGKTRKEAAAHIAVPEGTLAARLARGRVMLAKRLSRRGVVLSGGALAAVLSQNMASASVPTSLLASTIKVASTIAAGNAVAGVISPPVAALAEGVLKSMLLNKLKISCGLLTTVGTAVLLCGMVMALPGPEMPALGWTNLQVKAAQAPKEDKHKLQGTWQLVTTEFDGVKFGEGRPEIKDSRLVIEKSSFTLFSKLFHSPNVPLPPEDVKIVGTLMLDTDKHPKQIVLTWENDPWNNQKNFSRRGIYALDGDRLTICLSLDENPKKVPTDFSAGYGSKRHVMIFKREQTRKPQQGRDQAAANIADEINRLIQQLGSAKFNDREAAAQRLRELGPQALRLVQAAMNADDLEIARRCAVVEAAIRADVRSAFIKQFRVDGDEEYDHPVWQRFKSIVGASKIGRQLFADIIAVPRLFKLLDDAEAHPQKAKEIYADELILRVNAITKGLAEAEKEAGNRLGMRAPKTGMPTRAEFATLLLLGSHPATAKVLYSDDPVRDRGAHQDLFGHGLRVHAGNRLPNEFRRLFLAWHRVRATPAPVRFGMFYALYHGLHEALPTAQVVAANKDLPSDVRAAALLLIGHFGTADDLPLARQLFMDEAVFEPTTLEGRPYDVLTKDVAVAVALRLSGQDPAKFGYPLLTQLQIKAEDALGRYHLLGFPDTASREAAHQKARAWLDQQGQKAERGQ